MKELNKNINDGFIINFLCIIRAKLANQRKKKHLLLYLTKNKEYNYHLDIKKKPEKKDNEDFELCDVLPRRKKWINVDKALRIKNNNIINSIKRNIISLKLSINHYKNTNPEEPFLKNLEKFIFQINNNFTDNNYKIKEPKIIPLVRKNKCRPISNYSLKDKILISYANKCLTKLLDKYFKDCSFAFRALKSVENKKVYLSHHDAINSIVEYRKKYFGKDLWVAECDMKKFYDSVSHTIIRKYFKRLINKVKKDNPELYDEYIESILNKYLNSYNFYKNVYILNNNNNYWKEFNNIKNGCFGWVKDDLEKAGYFKSIKRAKIGVPQGGALSGLIANIVLDYADRKVLSIKDSELLYLRFCDDMIIIHPDKKICEEKFHIYINALKKLKLIPHQKVIDLSFSKESFWSEENKTKGPYKWVGNKIGNNPNDIPWIGFLGYEIHYDNSIRVRKSSLKKEIKKQNNTIRQILKAIQNGNRRRHTGTIEKSAINKLIGMSVGRVTLWNYYNIKNEMCWINGFRCLNNNKYSRTQLKYLDRNKNKVIYELKKLLKDESNEGFESDDEKTNKQIIYYGAPFSYYYQGLRNKTT